MADQLRTDELEERAIDPGPDHIVGPGYSYGTVTDKISNVVMRPLQRTPVASLFFANV